MAEPKIQPGVKVSEHVWEQFRQDVTKRRGTVHGNLSHELETAIREYLNVERGGDLHDRLNRIEDKLDAVAKGDTTDGDGGSERDSVSTTTEKRIDKIMADIKQRADELDSPRVREQDVEAAIERNAGTAYKTIQRYKRLLQNQREIFTHPTVDDVFFVRPGAFIASVEQSNMRPGDYAEVRETFGDEWWESNAPDGLLEDGRGFQ